MSLSTSFSSKVLIIAFATLICLSGCAHVQEGQKTTPSPGGAGLRVVVLPIDNLSDTPAPLKEIHKELEKKLRAAGVEVIDDELMRQSMARHRIRYVGGVDAITAKAFKDELNADAVFITSLELYSESPPPKLALVTRLVSTEENPEIEWVESAGIAGDDSPGILGLGLIEDPVTLRDKALARLAESFGRWLAEKNRVCPPTESAKKFRPKEIYNASTVKPATKNSIAVVPFYNESLRKHAGEIVQLHFIRQLACRGNVVLLEPGVIRDKMLQLRMVMREGVSLRDVDLLTDILNVDFVLSGKVFDYLDSQGGFGAPVIDFSSLLIEKKDKRVVWESKSYNKGDEGVYFFDVGRVTTANVMAGKMISTIVPKMAGGK
jgi:TolB-like protein